MAVTSIYPTITPPIVPDMEPAFLKHTVCKIYFSFSAYNVKGDIKNIQVSVVNQQTNESVLKSDYPAGIKIISGWSTDSDEPDNTIHQRTNFNDNYPYYINLYPEDLTEGFESNTIYKVQLRFTHMEAQDPPDGKATAQWINDNLNYFSEWSKVCLIKGISQPTISINELNGSAPISQPLAFTGKLSFANAEQSETLKSYNIIIKQKSTNKVVLQSNEIYTDPFSPNKIYYQLLYDLAPAKTYQLIVTYSTNNLYIGSQSFQFTLKQQSEQRLIITLEITPEESNGSMKLTIKPSQLNRTNLLIIRRASSKTNFLQWETVKKIAHTIGDPSHIWYDTSIESGVWYKYRIQQDIQDGYLSKISQPVMCMFEDIFLTQGNKQLKVQFNPAVSDFKYNVAESQQVTLGSQYPYIKRNGNNYYRTFSLSGLISALMDEIHWYDPGLQGSQFYDKNSIQPFTTANELFGEAAALYNEYNQTNDINFYQDYVYEREFRQKVMQFLYKNDIKLFRSLTEGNILIKLTNIAFQPIDILGRRLYSFSATATEINQNTLENLTKYNLINKIYYTYAKRTLQDIFKSEESLIDKFYSSQPIEPKETTDIMKLDISHDTGNSYIPHDFVVYAKPINNNNLLRYIAPKNKSLQIFYSDADPIAESYFYGIHFNDDELLPQEGHYENPQDVQNPVNYGVYSIVEHYFIRIDRYIEYFRDADLLTTYHDEVLQNSIDNEDYDLLVESMEPVYFNMIYYEGQWYPLLDNNDIIIKDFPAKITFTYRTKKED